MIEFLTKDPEARYEDLLNKVQVWFSLYTSNKSLILRSNEQIHGSLLCYFSQDLYILHKSSHNYHIAKLITTFFIESNCTRGDIENLSLVLLTFCIMFILKIMVFSLQTTVPPENCPSFTEDALLRHAQFLVEQVSMLIPQTV